LHVVLKGISQAARVYKTKYNQPVIIFMDDLTSLAKNDKETFSRLIKFARDEAVEKNLIINFVASEGNTPRQIDEMSEKSRLGLSIEIGDLDLQITIKYIELMHQKLTPENAKYLYDITGGRFTIIQDALQIFLDKNLNETRKDLIEKARKDFGVLKLTENPNELNPRQIKGWNQIIRIYDAPGREILFREFEEFLTAPVASELIAMNVFAYHPSRNTVSLQSRPVELLVGDTIGEPGSEKRREFFQFLSKNK